MSRLNELLKKRDEYRKSNNVIEEIKILEEIVKESINENEDEYILALNEYAGTIKYVGEYEKGLDAIEKALSLIQNKYGIDSVMYATTLLNKTEILRFANKLDDLEKNYLKVLEIYKNHKMQENYEYAGLCNNLALYYQNIGNYQKAYEYYNISLNILKTMSNHKVEYATTLSNIVEPLKNLGNKEKAHENLLEALKIYDEKLGILSTSYAGALNNLAIFYLEDNEKAIKIFKKCLNILKKTVGINSLSYKNVLDNINLLEKDKVVTKDSPIMDIVKSFYNHHILPKMDNNLRENVVIGLFGAGSECMGLDDEISKDHDMCVVPLILVDSKEDEQKMMDILNNLPETYLGYSTKIEGVNKERRGIHNLSDYTKDIFYDKYNMLNIPRQTYIELTNGEIFLDESNKLSTKRNSIVYYPKDIKTYLFANQCYKIYQSGQYNLIRMIKRKDYLSAEYILNEFIKNVIDFVYNLNSEYVPFYKWKLKKLEKLDILGQEILDRINSIKQIDIKNANMIENKVFEICFLLLKELRKQYILSEDSLMMVDYTNHLVQKITDEKIRSISAWRYDG